ncbi:MAG: hypothetical protein ABI624_13120 [Casimicrobiaceae bacterium]
MIKTVIGSFDSITEAAAVARDLRAAGFLDDDVNVVANHAPRQSVRGSDLPPEPPLAAEDGATSAAAGVVTGGALGGAAGLAVSLLGLVVPGFGPLLAAGPIAAALAGAGAGAVAGGLIGGLVDLGVPAAEAEHYAESVRRGGALVTVRTDVSRTDEAERIMRQQGAIDIEDRATRWRAAGWQGPNASEVPLAQGESARERTLSARR